MTEKVKILRTVEWVLAILLLALPVVTFHWGRSTAMPGEGETARDTIIKKVSVYKDFPDPVKTASAGFVPIPSYRFFSDTITREIATVLHETDTVWLPREQKYYEEDEGRLRLWVSGFDPQLDRWELDRVETTITETYTPRRKRWGLTFTAGYGVTLADGKVVLSPFVGGGISWIITSW